MQKVAAETAARGIPPEEVAKDVPHALTAPKPKTRYLVGRDAKMRARIAKRRSGPDVRPPDRSRLGM